MAGRCQRRFAGLKIPPRPASHLIAVGIHPQKIGLNRRDPPRLAGSCVAVWSEVFPKIFTFGEP